MTTLSSSMKFKDERIVTLRYPRVWIAKPMKHSTPTIVIELMFWVDSGLPWLAATRFITRVEFHIR